MDTFYEPIDLAFGNVVEDYDREDDAIAALLRVVTEHGSQAISTFAVSRVQNGQRCLVAMQDDLGSRVEHEMRDFIPQRRTS